MEEQIISTPGRVKESKMLQDTLNNLLEQYSADQINDILLNTLYLAMDNPDNHYESRDFKEVVHLITQLTETFRKAELELTILGKD